MSTHNICFRGEIRKISAFLDEKSTLSVAMENYHFLHNSPLHSSDHGRLS